MSCAACRGTLVPFGPRAAYRYGRCAACGTIQLDPLPTPAELAEAYAAYEGAGHYEASADAARLVNANNYRTVLAALRDHGVVGPVLDVGSGWGGLVELAREQGFDCEGIDANQAMVASCRERGLPVRRGDLADVADRRYDAIVLSTVFEHLVDHDAWLEQARRLLVPGGLLVSLHPTARFAGLMGDVFRLGRRGAELPALVELYSPPWHTAFFSIEGMQTLLSRHGFALREVRFTPSGRKPGALGRVQATLEAINRVGWRLAGERWPLQVCHTFVFENGRGAAASDTTDPNAAGAPAGLS